MPSKMIKTKVLPEKYYHIFNQAINNDFLFRENDDYQFFLLKIKELIIDYFELYAYCLLPNHFHLLLKPLWEVNSIHDSSVNEKLRKLFQLYAQYYNKRYKRKGSLYLKPFRRLEIDTEAYLTYLVFYIHYNPQKHGIIGDYRVYDYSSYKFFICDQETKLQRDVVLKWFGDNPEDFVRFHQECLERKIGDGTPSLGMPSQGMASPFFLPLPKFQPL